MRKAEISDFDAIYKIYHQETVIHYLSYDPMSPDEFRNIFEAEVAFGRWFVYEFHGSVIGMLKANKMEGRTSHVAQVGSLALHEEFSGRGLATEMMRDLIEELKSNGIKRIQLIVESDNSRAIAFYQRLGFEKEGTLRKFYKRSCQDFYVDDYMMSLIIN